jgi:dihydroorotase
LTLNAKNIYKINPIEKEITLEKKDFIIPENY